MRQCLVYFISNEKIFNFKIFVIFNPAGERALRGGGNKNSRQTKSADGAVA